MSDLFLSLSPIQRLRLCLRFGLLSSPPFEASDLCVRRVRICKSCVSRRESAPRVFEASSKGDSFGLTSFVLPLSSRGALFEAPLWPDVYKKHFHSEKEDILQRKAEAAPPQTVVNLVGSETSFRASKVNLVDRLAAGLFKTRAVMAVHLERRGREGSKAGSCQRRRRCCRS